MRPRGPFKVSLLLLLCTFCIWLQLTDQSISASAAEPSQERFVGDFLEYWGAARLLVTGQNPYSPAQLLKLQRSVVSNKKQPLLMYNPPWTLFFLLPFGFLSFSTGWLVWLTLNASCLIVSAAALWRLYGGDSNQYRSAWLACFSVVPTYGVLFLSQITPLVLVGITAFLYFQARKQWWLAGLVLPLVAIKPHLAYLFWVALAANALRNGSWQVLVTGAIAGLVATLVPWFFAPSIFSNYVQLFLSGYEPLSYWATPTLSTALRVFWGLDEWWISYLPLLCGLIWFSIYWRERQTNWNWTNEMPLLLLISQATTPFAWTFDQVILLPALMEGALWSIRGGRPRIIIFALTIFFMVDFPQLLLFVNFLIPGPFWLFWMVPVFFLTYCTFKYKFPPETSLEASA